MKKIILYEYDKRNREDFLKQLEDAGYAFLSIMVGEDIQNVFGEITTATKGFIMDVTPFFRDDERSLSFALVVEKIIENMQDDWPVFIIIDRRYTYGFQDLLFHRLEKVESLEVTLACELFMKAIIIQKKGVQQRGHDPYDLYYELPEEQQQEVLDSYLLWTIPIGTEITEDIVGVKCDSFFDMLSVNARLFEVVRYKHEYSTIVFHDGYIHFLAKALKGVCEELNIDRE